MLCFGAQCHIGWDSRSRDDMTLSKIAIKDKVGNMSAFVMYHMTSSENLQANPICMEEIHGRKFHTEQNLNIKQNGKI